MFVLQMALMSAADSFSGRCTKSSSSISSLRFILAVQTCGTEKAKSDEQHVSTINGARICSAAARMAMEIV